MAKLTRCNKRYFQDTENIYMVCTALNKDGNYLWEIYKSNFPGNWYEEAHSGEWNRSPYDALNEGLDVFKGLYPEANEINFIEDTICLAGNFKDAGILKEEIVDLIHRNYPEILTYFN
jgi:hypothetical protein